MDYYAVKMERSGRILIPAALRRRLGLEPGKDVLIGAEDQGVTVVGTRASAVREIQARLRAYRLKRSLSQDLISERRAEAAAEQG